MEIREAKKDDIEKIMELLIQINNVHNEIRPDLFIKDKTKYTKEELERIIESKLTPIFVAVDGSGEIKGYMIGKFESHINDNNFSDIITLYIDDLCVDEKCRGNNIGKCLYEFTVKYAREKGCYNVTLNVWEGNECAKAFYDSCGLKVQKYGLEIII